MTTSTPKDPLGGTTSQSCLNGNRRILVVDDNASIHDDYRKVLVESGSSAKDDFDRLASDLFGEAAPDHWNETFDVDFALQGEEALDLAKKAKDSCRRFAMAFVDIRMPPGMDGIETAERLWQTDPDLLIVLCSAHSDYSWGELVDRLGANDRWLILKKPFDAVEVRQLALAMTQKWESTKDNRQYAASLEAMVQEQTAALREEMDKLREAQKEVSYLAQHDALTSLPNRRFLETHLNYQVQMAKRHGRGLAIISADLDRFKWINDTLGHAAGDLVLKTVAARLRSSLKDCDCVVRGTNPPDETETDTVARLGGDEFIVLLTDVKLPEEVADVARRITDLMSHPITVDGQEISVGASLGIAMQPADGDDAETLLRKADAAMYAAKLAGRNSFRFYTSDLHRGVDNRLWLENEMEKALEQRAFTLAFQPEVDATTGVVIGAEALLRWHHPDRGFISPAEFIPVAEETGLIGPLGTYALLEACRYAVTAVRQIATFQRVAVNVSAKQLRDERFVDIVQHALHSTGLSARHLELEITESAFVEPKVDANLSRLRELGVSIALDDFGTGYSSLAHLVRWPIDTVKIDRSFVTDLPNNPKSLGMVRGIMALARCFAGRVVAEGIEEPQQRDMLLKEGCKVMQGYMFCKPLPFEEFLKWSVTAMAPRSVRPSRSPIAQLQTQGGAE